MPLRTAQEITRRPPVNVPLGEPLYKKTAQVRLSSPIRGVSGRLKREWIYSTRKNGACVVRPWVEPHDPRTTLQLDRRECFRAAQRNWSRVSPTDRGDWGAWALKHFYGEPDGPGAGQAGYLAYVGIQTYRQAMGEGLAAAAPAGPPPPAVLEISQEAPPEEAAFAFRVRHGLTNVEGLRLLVELTPATATLRRKPEEGKLVWFAANAREAFVPLQADGAVYVLREARFPVETGRRYGVRMRLVTGEGVAGPAITGDFVKKASEQPPERSMRMIMEFRNPALEQRKREATNEKGRLMGFRSTIRAVDLDQIRRMLANADEALVEMVLNKARAEYLEDPEDEEELENWEDAVRKVLIHRDLSHPRTPWIFDLLVDLVDNDWVADEWSGDAYGLLAAHADKLPIPEMASAILRHLASVRAPGGETVAPRGLDVFASFITKQEGRELLKNLQGLEIPADLEDTWFGNISSLLSRTLKENLIPALEEPIPSGFGYYLWAS